MEINPCPFCGNDDPQWEDNEEELLRLCCPECGAAGPLADTHQDAAELWNHRT